MYYIISLKHTHREDKYITLWRPNNSGYCYSKEDAGEYSELKDGYHNLEHDSLPILIDELEGLFINSNISRKNIIQRCVPNCKQVWDILNLKMTKSGLVKRFNQAV